MKSSLFSKTMILATAALLAAGGYAAGAVHKGSLQVGDAVQVNGKQLPAGEYTVTWQGDGPNVDIHIAQGRKELATAAATVVPLDTKASQDSAEITTSSGARELSAIRFAGQKYQLELVSSGSARSGDSMK
jgi:hypothetical protein